MVRTEEPQPTRPSENSLTFFFSFFKIISVYGKSILSYVQAKVILDSLFPHIHIQMVRSPLDPPSRYIQNLTTSPLLHLQHADHCNTSLLLLLSTQGLISAQQPASSFEGKSDHVTPPIRTLQWLQLRVKAKVLTVGTRP